MGQHRFEPIRLFGANLRTDFQRTVVDRVRQSFFENKFDSNQFFVIKLQTALNEPACNRSRFTNSTRFRFKAETELEFAISLNWFLRPGRNSTKLLIQGCANFGNAIRDGDNSRIDIERPQRHLTAAGDDDSRKTLNTFHGIDALPCSDIQTIDGANDRIKRTARQ